MNPADVTLAVIAKTPVAGRVKTRLCPPCSPQQAADIARASLQDTLDAAAASSANEHVVVLDGARPEWIDERFRVVAQRGNGLDERLAAAFDDLGGPMVIIGMDTPQVTAALLDDALAALCGPGVESVIGPASDGGYWAIGLTRPDSGVFLGVPMSSAATYAHQVARLDDRGYPPVVLAELTDIDTFADAVAVGATVPGTRLACAVAEVECRVSSGHP